MTNERRTGARAAEAERNDRALLKAARDVVSADGAHASVAAIAARAGVGIGSLYRRYRTKEDLFRHLLTVTIDEYARISAEALNLADPWDGLVHYMTTSIGLGPGSLAPIAGTITLTPEITERSRRSDEAVAVLVERAHAAGRLRADVTAADIELLIEQLGRSPLREQLEKQHRTDLMPAADHAVNRMLAIVLDGLRAGPGHPELPGPGPGYELFYERWRTPDDPE